MVKLNDLEPIEEEVDEFLISDYSLLPTKQEEEKFDSKGMGFISAKDKSKLAKFSEDLKDSLTGNDRLSQDKLKSKIQ
jgi:hypothetical protein